MTPDKSREVSASWQGVRGVTSRLSRLVLRQIGIRHTEIVHTTAEIGLHPKVSGKATDQMELLGLSFFLFLQVSLSPVAVSYQAHSPLAIIHTEQMEYFWVVFQESLPAVVPAPHDQIVQMVVLGSDNILDTLHRHTAFVGVHCLILQQPNHNLDQLQFVLCLEFLVLHGTWPNAPIGRPRRHGCRPAGGPLVLVTIFMPFKICLSERGFIRLATSFRNHLAQFSNRDTCRIEVDLFSKSDDARRWGCVC
jgi:hypothetical protein